MGVYQPRYIYLEGLHVLPCFSLWLGHLLLIHQDCAVDDRARSTLLQVGGASASSPTADAGRPDLYAGGDYSRRKAQGQSQRVACCKQRPVHIQSAPRAASRTTRTRCGECRPRPPQVRGPDVRQLCFQRVEGEYPTDFVRNSFRSSAMFFFFCFVFFQVDMHVQRY